jgi:TolC family type I secretion outer membrane protein
MNIYTRHTAGAAFVAALLASATVPTMAAAQDAPSPVVIAAAPASDQADASGPVTSLDMAFDRAYWSNPTLLAERARLKSTDYRLPQARARSGPQLSAEAGYGYSRNNIEQPTGGFAARSGWAPSAAAILSQPLFTFGRNASAERGASAQIDYQRAVLRAMEQQVLLQTVSVYADVRRERAAVRIALENLALLERELVDNTSRLKVRDTTRTDVEQVGTRVEIGRAQLLQAKRAAALAEAEFLKTVGSPAGDLAAPVLLVQPSSSLEDAFSFAQKIHPILIAAHARERASRAEIDAARAERKPRVDLRGRAGIDTNLFGIDRVRQSTVRGEVLVSGPIFQSGALTARVEEAKAANDADWRLIDQALRETRIEITDAWNEWITAEAALVNLSAAVQLAEQAYGGAVQQERVGMRTTLDVLDLARDLLSAKVNYNQTLATAQIAKARVLAATGLLDQEHVAPGKPRYDEQRNFNRVKNDGDVPVLTSIVRAIDRVPLGSKANREGRDPLGPMIPPAVAVPSAAETSNPSPQ